MAMFVLVFLKNLVGRGCTKKGPTIVVVAGGVFVVFPRFLVAFGWC